MRTILPCAGWALFYRPLSAAALQDAQRAFEQALDLDPQSVGARIGLATVLATMMLEGWSISPLEEQARVEGLLAEVFAHGANDPMAYHAMAMLRRSQNRLTEARIAAERSITLDHNNSAALYELGVTRMYLGQPEVGIPHIEKAIGSAVAIRAWSRCSTSWGDVICYLATSIRRLSCSIGCAQRAPGIGMSICGSPPRLASRVISTRRRPNWRKQEGSNLKSTC